MQIFYGYDKTGRLRTTRHGQDKRPWETTQPPPAPSGDAVPFFLGGRWVLKAEEANLRPTPPEFMAASFTFSERIAIRAARDTDPVVADFLTLIDDPRLTMVDLTLPSTQGAIGYLTTTDPQLLTAERAAEVLAGLPAPANGGA